MSRDITVYTTYTTQGNTRLALHPCDDRGGGAYPFRVVYRVTGGMAEGRGCWFVSGLSADVVGYRRFEDTAEAIAWLLEGEKGSR